MIVVLVVVTLLLCHISKKSNPSTLESIGITVNGLVLSWTSSSLCTWLGRVGSKLSRGLECWFGFGALVCSFIAALNLLLLAVNFIRLSYFVLVMMLSTVGVISHSEDGNNTSEILTPSPASVVTSVASVQEDSSSPLLLEFLIPGLTIPSSHVSHLFFAAFVTLSFHELGHALAAAATHLHITNFGFSLYVIFPTTFVIIEDHIRRISPYRQLRIYTAGAFHNLLQSLAVFVILPVVPMLLQPTWMTCSISNSNKCVWVSKIKNTVLEDVLQLSQPVGAIGITRVNGMDIGSVRKWLSVVDELKQQQSQQYCVMNEIISSTSTEMNCCQKGYNGTLLCFEHFPNSSSSKPICISGRKVADSPLSSECCGSVVDGYNCLLLSEAVIGDRNTFLFKIEFTSGQQLTFIDTLQSVIQIGVREYHPTYLPISATNLYDDDRSPYWEMFPYSVVPDFPEDLVIFLIYVQMLSLGLLLVNLVPFPGLDGQFIFSCLLQILSERLCSPPAPTPELEEIVVNSNVRHQQQQQQLPTITSSDLSTVRLVGQYGDTGLVDHQLQQKAWRRYLMIFGTILLVGNWSLSLIITLCKK